MQWRRAKGTAVAGRRERERKNDGLDLSEREKVQVVKCERR